MHTVIGGQFRSEPPTIPSWSSLVWAGSAVSVFSQACDAGRVAALARGNRAYIAHGFVDDELVASP